MTSGQRLPGFLSALIVTGMVGLPATAFASPDEDFKSGQSAYRSGDMVGAMPSLKRAADAGHAPAQVLYGYILDQAEFNEEAAQYYRRAADQGHAEGEYALAALYAAGEGVPRDAGVARALFERAARQDHAPAIKALSAAHLAGQLGFKSEGDVDGLAWTKKAADYDHVPSLGFLAKAYRSGSFGVVDVTEAERIEARMRKLTGEDQRKTRRRNR